jgi:hypothetical protein
VGEGGDDFPFFIIQMPIGPSNGGQAAQPQQGTNAIGWFCHKSHKN